MAALLLVLLIAAVVVGVHAWTKGDLNPRPVPAGEVLTITQYQSLVSKDDVRLDNTSRINCASFVYPNCLPAVAVANDAAQKWLDDLNRSQPPARFAAMDALLRRHLGLLILDNAAYVTAYKAKDQNGRNTTSVAANAEQYTLDSAVAVIDVSRQGTIASYSASVGLGRADLLACALCQQLVSPGTVSCPPSQMSNCVYEIGAVRLQLEAFQEDLVRYSAPDSLVAKDLRLQADLMAAGDALDAMTHALSGNPVELQTGYIGLRQALGRVDSDASDIAGSK